MAQREIEGDDHLEMESLLCESPMQVLEAFELHFPNVGVIILLVFELDILFWDRPLLGLVCK